MRERKEIHVTDIDIFEVPNREVKVDTLLYNSVKEIYITSLVTIFNSKPLALPSEKVTKRLIESGVKVNSIISVDLKRCDIDSHLLEKSKAVRIFPIHHNFSLRDSKILRNLSMLEKNNKPLIIQGRVLWKDKCNLPFNEIKELAEKFPNLKIIISGVNYGETLNIMRFVKPFDNIYIAISYFQPLNGVELLVKKLGSGRVLFGSAYPLNYLESSLLKVLMANLSEEDKERILYLNAKEIFSR